MSLDFSKLHNVKPSTGFHRAACPACRENGGDRKGNHLFIAKGGHFGCAAFQGDHEHRKRIHALAGTERSKFLPERSIRQIVQKKPRAFSKSENEIEDDAPMTPMPPDILELSESARWNLFSDGLAQELASKEFGISPETVASCTMPASGALGFFSSVEFKGKPCKPNRFGYIYMGGIKIRKPWGQNGPPFVWLFGRATEPWRSLLRPFHFKQNRIILTEGESDALALIDAGVEKHFPCQGETGTVVVASPGTSFKSEWATLFEDREVIIAFDNDSPGREAARRTAELLSPHAKSVHQFRPEALFETRESQR